MIGPCLESLCSSRYPTDITVVDNRSKDETEAVVRGFHQANLLKSSSNLGFGLANNLAIRAAIEDAPDYFFLLNQDARVLPSTLGALVATAEARPELGILSPLQLAGSGASLDSKFSRFLFEGAPQSLSDAMLAVPAGFYAVPFVNAAAWLVRSSVFLRAGGFDPLFFMYLEDNDLCYRARLHGFDIGISALSRIIHLRYQSADSTGRQAFKFLSMRRRSEMTFLVKSSKRPVGVEYVRQTYGGLRMALRALGGGDVSSAASWVLAVVGLGARIGKIVRHRRISMTQGPHWLR